MRWEQTFGSKAKNQPQTGLDRVTTAEFCNQTVLSNSHDDSMTEILSVLFIQEDDRLSESLCQPIHIRAP